MVLVDGIIYCWNWPRLCIGSRGWTCHLAWVGSPVTQHLAWSLATPVYGLACNHGSWRKNVVNFHSTTIIKVVAIKPCNFWSRIICSKISITSFKSTLHYWECTLLCTRDLTMVNECKQSVLTSSTQLKKNSQGNTFQDHLKSGMDLYCHRVCPGTYLKYAFSIYKAKYDDQIGESLWQSWHYLICIITHGLCSYNAQLLNDDVTSIRISYWWRREFPN